MTDGAVGRLRCVLAPREAVTERCEAFLCAEGARGVTELPYYEHFDARAHSMLRELHDLLRSLRADGRSISAYGAEPGAVTLLNAGDIAADLVDVVVERDESVQGLQLPGVRVPIVAPDALRRERTDYLLVLRTARDAATHRDLRGFLADGGRLIVPGPSPEVVGSPD